MTPSSSIDRKEDSSEKKEAGAESNPTGRMEGFPELNQYVRGVGTLVGIQRHEPPPPKTYTDYIFEEITARIELRLGGEPLKKMSTLWDFYGKNTSVEYAIREASEYAHEHGIGPKSEVEVVVVKIVSQVRKRPQEKQNFYDTRFVNFEALQIQCRRDLPDDVETIAWSSRQAPSVVAGGEPEQASGVSSK